MEDRTCLKLDSSLREYLRRQQKNVEECEDEMMKTSVGIKNMEHPEITVFSSKVCAPPPAVTMISPDPSAAPPGLPKPFSPSIPSSFPTSIPPQTSALPPSPPSSFNDTTSLPLVDVSDSPTPDTTSYPPPTFPDLSTELSSKPSTVSHHMPKSPVPTPPLPILLPSALPKSNPPGLPRPPPPPILRTSSPPQPRPPPPVIPKQQASTSAMGKSSKPAPPGISVLEKLIKTCPVWLKLGMKKDRVSLILSKENPGIFLIRRDTSQKNMVLAVRLPDHLGEPNVKELHVMEEKALVYLDGSVLVFENIFKLIAFYCVSRDILPFPLKLPQAIQKVTKYEDMEVISSLGSEFWSSALNIHEELEIIGGGCDSLDSQGQNSACEIQLSIGGDRLWYVNPIFIEECSNSFCPNSTVPVQRTQSLNAPLQAPPKFKRPPPLRPRPPTVPETSLHKAIAKPPKEDFHAALSSPPSLVKKREGSDCENVDREQERGRTSAPSTEHEKTAVSQSAQGKELLNLPSHRVPPIPIRRKLSEKQASEDAVEEVCTSTPGDPEKICIQVPVESLICLDDGIEEQDKPMDLNREQHPKVPTDEFKEINGSPVVSQKLKPHPARPNAPVAPPRRKKTPQNLTGLDSHCFRNLLTPIPQEEPTSTSTGLVRDSLCINVGQPKASDVSLYSPEGGAPLDHDSYSTSSTEEDTDSNVTSGVQIKRTPTIMLDRAKQRLSMVSMANLSNVLTGFMNADRKLQKRIVELSRDGNTYFGNLVKDYRAYTLETMRRQTSSTEMLQEIRQMMTQLKSYLIQSTELQNLQEAAACSDEKLEIVIEAALCKSVLKPLREAVYNGLKDIHSRAGNMKKLKENQQVVKGTTTTDLGVTTSVPEMAIMEKIQSKLGNMHQEYSPQKKIDMLLKTCKVIYESMSVGSPGKAHGADDFLPVLMYVLARCNIILLLLDVEYMMELMDPALQLGEVRSNSTAKDLCAQCAEKFEVLDPESYCLSVLVEGQYTPLAPEEFPLTIKSTFHYSEPRKEYYFVYRHGHWSEQESVERTPSAPAQEESLI
ncbi:hypothetical protein DNTS_009348 [Danionella cerebrum]|uniref:VPS9 domain-containing protein n=1 Tax=Danionella cerebrum TaxID=2873325 RepID=A0A553QKC4_9TELE|nr:hypothetical protein DNTS_009348 [Danionella translucida]